jgi:acyl carrier protein
MMPVLSQLEPIFHMVFDDDSIQLRPEMTADDVDGWDSLSHVNLIVAIEGQFGIRFTQKELLTFRNVGDLINSIASKANLPAV